MNLTSLRADIPALDEATYCNWGASGPSPRRVVSTVEETLAHHEYEAPTAEGMYPAAFDVYDATRETVADFVGATEQDVALTQSTTDGINRVASAIDWNAGDEVVITDLEHSAGRLPWRRLERDPGITVTVLETDAGRIDLDAFTDAVAGARLTCFSAIDWLYGRRHPVSDLVAIARDAGVTTLVDAVQVPGQQPFDVTDWGADAVAAAGHKWVLGPWGAGFLHIDPAAADAFRPRSVGYRSVEDPNAGDYQFKPGAHRFEVGTTSPAPYAGLATAMETLEDIGLSRIEARIEELTSAFKAGLPDGVLLSPESFHSGLVSFEVDDPEATVERLAEDGVHLRSLPRPNTVRVSLHAVNTEADVDRVLDALDE